MMKVSGHAPVAAAQNSSVSFVDNVLVHDVRLLRTRHARVRNPRSCSCLQALMRAVVETWARWCSLSFGLVLFFPPLLIVGGAVFSSSSFGKMLPS